MDDRVKRQVKAMNKLKKNIYIEEKLSKYSWFNLGGPAEIMFKPDTIEELSEFLKKNKKKIFVLGAGSNTLIRDGGIRGVAIKLSPKFSNLRIINEKIIEVGAATLDKTLSNFAKDNSLSGFEFLSGIPGSIGGAIRMNCGCYGADISKILISINVIDFKGKKNEIKADQIDFFYRGTSLPDDLIILSAKFKGLLDSKDAIEKRQALVMEKKKKDQPSRVKTCGSTFKNPTNEKAWRLIKKSNCDKIRIGKIRISDKHCNFFINEGNGTSKDIEKLITTVKKEVFKKTGINLELEIKIIGSSN
jgi:UDP-N-acetylmuramate dehydrogenase|tara:strand:+ start:225 stop:1133 length:909 start_codon:yes stop_codon:yes gene_type:complete